MNKIETHIEKLFRDIPDSNHKSEIIQEIDENLNEKVADLVSQGLSEESAVQKAIEDFGDIDEIRAELMSGEELRRSKNLDLALAFSLWSSLLFTGLFLFINFYYTPGQIWFVYPVFAVIWWPMSLYFYRIHKKSGRSTAFPYAVSSFILIMALLLFINFYYTPHIIWVIYPAFALIWWPLGTLFYRLRQKSREDDCLNE